MKAPEIDAAVERIEGGDRQPLYLVIGEQVLATRGATRIAKALAAAAGCEVAVHKGAAGAELESVLVDLFTFSLFEPAKVALVVDCAEFASKDAAAELIDEAARALKDDYALSGGEGLTLPERSAAGRLLQTLRLFEVDPFVGTADEVIASLPDFALAGGKEWRKGGRRGRLKKERAGLARGLTALLAAAREEGLSGWSADVLADLDRAVDGGLPEGHALVFAERSADKEHPIVRRLFERKTAFEIEQIRLDGRGEATGLRSVLDELERETGVGIDPVAAQELARRTLRKVKGAGSWGEADVEATSAARFVAEYRKLAGGRRGSSGRIDRAMVEEMVTDRGEEDTWKLLDTIGDAGPERALQQLRRFLDTAPDEAGALFPFAAALGGFCQHMAAIHGALSRVEAPTAHNYNAFRSRVLPKLKPELPESVAKVSPFRLFRAYQAASRRQGPEADRLMAELPWRVLETDYRLRGGSDDRVAAVEALVALVAGGGSRR
ncbi:MAG: hypothetical protein OXH32_12930 [Acidobacteria bacterium]|nr:hypothetical protein [Acidobacteriota bacterium]